MLFVNMSANLSNESSSLQAAFCDVHLKNFEFFPVRILKIVLYSIILVCSLAGNILIITIVRKRVDLRNTINYFIVNTAMSDLIFLLTIIPVQLSQAALNSRQWPFGGTTGLIFCKLKWFLQSASITVSVQSLVWIALDRFVAVVLPMKVHLISSRFRVFAITSTWIVAMIATSPLLYTHQLVERNEEILCEPLYNTFLSYVTFLKVYIALFQILPVVVMTILYCAIAVTLRRQDKALQCRAVHQKDQRKRRATKISFCIMTSFYICVLPSLLAFVFKAYEVKLSCWFSQALWFIANVTLLLSSLVNPTICTVFIQNYRLGMKEFFRSHWKRMFTASNIETSKPAGITLQDIRVTPWMGENPAYIE